VGRRKPRAGARAGGSARPSKRAACGRRLPLPPGLGRRLGRRAHAPVAAPSLSPGVVWRCAAGGGLLLVHLLIPRVKVVGQGDPAGPCGGSARRSGGGSARHSGGNWTPRS
jgi:hypothetical protein